MTDVRRLTNTVNQFYTFFCGLFDEQTAVFLIHLFWRIFCVHHCFPLETSLLIFNKNVQKIGAEDV
jgi:hypothetical protein